MRSDLEDRRQEVAYRRMCRASTGAHILSHVKERLVYQYQRASDQRIRNRFRDSIVMISYLKDECNDDYYRYMREYSNDV